MIKHKTEFKGFLTLLAAGFLYSLYGVLSRLIGGSLDSFFQFWSRGLIVLSLLFFITFLKKKSLKKIQNTDWGWIISLSIVSGIIIPTFFIAINNLAIGTMLFMFYALSIISSFLIGNLILNESISKSKIISIIFALFGLLLMYAETIHLGNVFYLSVAGLSGGLFGANLTIIRKLQKRYSSIQINTFNWLGVLIVNIITSLFLKENWSFNLISIHWLANFTLAICSLVASLLVVYGMKFISSQKASLILLSELIFGVIVGFLMYDEMPSISILIGSIFILIALALPNLKSNKIKAIGTLIRTNLG